MYEELPQPNQATLTPRKPTRPVRTAHGETYPAIPVDRPSFRRLRVYAFDPGLSTQLDNAVVNNVTVKVPWEFDLETGEDTLKPGPVGDYLEVVDFDPASACFYAPLDLGQSYLLAQDGLAPSEGNPQFHQQMVYAVAMTTIHNFERALGRTAFWAPQRWEDAGSNGKPQQREEYVRRLRIYPHALREANAYYSPQKKALLFGYFPASNQPEGRHLPGGTVFTCLSHDIIAHETTHALLDGIHRRFAEPSNPDVLAFHEAFADIVALFQHFSFPDVLRHQIARTRGDLASENLLGQLAQEFGQATGVHGALRDAIGEIKDGQWRPKQPDPTEIQRTTEPHARGALLVAAVFDAFVSIYKRRIADLLRIATNGTGVLPEGQLHPDLVNRLASEAAKSAQHVLNMCIRALDYAPPLDLTFGDYLRALITADYDLVPDDDLGYRVALVEAFRRRGIYPRDVRSMAIDSLRWTEATGDDFEPIRLLEEKDRLKWRGILEWNMAGRNKATYERLAMLRGSLHNRLNKHSQHRDALFHLCRACTEIPFEIHSVRPLRRIGPDGQVLVDLVIEVTQKKAGYFDRDIQRKVDAGAIAPPTPDFAFRGGATLLVNWETSQVRYAIYKDIANDDRRERQRNFLTNDTDTSLRAMYFGRISRDGGEPFAFLHRAAEMEV